MHYPVNKGKINTFSKTIYNWVRLVDARLVIDYVDHGWAGSSKKN